MKSRAENNCHFPGSLVPGSAARALCPATCSRACTCGADVPVVKDR